MHFPRKPFHLLFQRGLLLAVRAEQVLKRFMVMHVFYITKDLLEVEDFVKVKSQAL